ncbi:pyridoxamine 5'-phosphate oxidase family protein [Pseudonocardia pini]|uniref:pyridoxamine 5'-phosphate oxidase family protein n=1 Tax=Pseudonocardia pini TaxID=2758030 RepID=UPI0015F07BA4|nr:pyridoxamine 5'-phosphate oxidase family protein [Pseudonocardia pini]
MTTFHEGELAVQRRAGVAREAARLSGMLTDPSLDGGMGGFLAQRDLAVLTARDGEGRLWTSPLVGTPGFLDGSGRHLAVHAGFADTDPLHGLPAGQPVGLVTVDFARRRRLRVNGTLTAAGPTGLAVEVDQAYGNCPQYIRPRHLDPAGAPPRQVHARTSTSLTDAHRSALRSTATLFVGTLHPGGADASHRGGAPGFVRVDGDRVWWPDYPGNNMFNTLGNLAVDDSAALLVLDFERGGTLHLSGRAAVEWTAPGATDDEGGTGRRVTFRPELIVEADDLPLRATAG